MPAWAGHCAACWKYIGAEVYKEFMVGKATHHPAITVLSALCHEGAGTAI